MEMLSITWRIKTTVSKRRNNSLTKSNSAMYFGFGLSLVVDYKTVSLKRVYSLHCCPIFNFCLFAFPHFTSRKGNRCKKSLMGFYYRFGFNFRSLVAKPISG